MMPTKIATIVFFCLVFCFSPLEAKIKYSNGAYYATFQDSAFAAPTAYGFKRTYSSNITKEGWFGKGWISELETYLELQKNSLVVHHYGQAKAESFSKKDNGVYVSKEGNEIQTKSGKYYLGLAKRTLTFDSKGRLIHLQYPETEISLEYQDNKSKPHNIKGKNFQEMRLNWLSTQQLKSMTSISGEEISFVYKVGNLIQVKKGKDIWDYSYDGQDNLIEISFPGQKKRIIKYLKNRVVYVRDEDEKETTLHYVEEKNTLKVEATIKEPGKKSREEIHTFEFLTPAKKQIAGYTSPQGVKYKVDPQTDLVLESDEGENTKQFFYDKKGWPKTVKINKNDYQFYYNKQGQITSIRGGKEFIDYLYDKNGLLSKISSNQKNVEIAYTKDGQYKLISLRYPKNKERDIVLQVKYNSNKTIDRVAIKGIGDVKSSYEGNKLVEALANSKDTQVKVAQNVRLLFRELVLLTEPLGIDFGLLGE